MRERPTKREPFVTHEPLLQFVSPFDGTLLFFSFAHSLRLSLKMLGTLLWTAVLSFYCLLPTVSPLFIILLVASLSFSIKLFLVSPPSTPTLPHGLKNRVDRMFLAPSSLSRSSYSSQVSQSVQSFLSSSRIPQSFISSRSPT